jgi:hypothetical protein
MSQGQSYFPWDAGRRTPTLEENIEMYRRDLLKAIESGEIPSLEQAVLRTEQILAKFPYYLGEDLERFRGELSKAARSFFVPPNLEGADQRLQL